MKFEMWYDKVKDGEFNLQRELEKDCQLDVDILMNAVQRF
jgi:hypothetical protein